MKRNCGKVRWVSQVQMVSQGSQVTGAGEWKGLSTGHSDMAEWQRNDALALIKAMQ